MYPEYLRLSRLYLITLLEKCDELYKRAQSGDSLENVFNDRVQIHKVFEDMQNSKEYQKILDHAPSLRTITCLVDNCLMEEENRLSLAKDVLIKNPNPGDQLEFNSLEYETRKSQLVEFTLSIMSVYCQSILQDARFNSLINYQEFKDLMNMLKNTNYTDWSDNFSHIESDAND